MHDSNDRRLGPAFDERPSRNRTGPAQADVGAPVTVPVPTPSYLGVADE